MNKNMVNFNISENIVNNIINNLNNRKGISIDILDEDTQEEIKESWINIVDNIIEVPNDNNKILQKLIDQFGREEIYTILSYELWVGENENPFAVIEHMDGTPTRIEYNKISGEWR